MNPEDENCVCGHEFEDHVSVSEGMLPLCAWCACVGPHRTPGWLRGLRRAT